LDLKKKFTQNKEISFRQFKTVAPGWDNTARRLGSASIFINSSPQIYGAWLNEIIQEEERNFPPEERVVFINAWNEWAEGAYLEPDRKYGYAFLNKTKEVVTEKKIAIIIHAYYKDIFGEIIELITKIKSINLKLIVTTTRENFSDVETALIASKLNFELLSLENKGRDILPFLKILKSERLEGYKYFLKLHTKKSPHRIDGERWRNEMIGTLLKEEFLLDFMEYSEKNAEIGMIGPVGHILPMSYYWGSNQKKILDAAVKLGFTKDDLLKIKFVAGSMFFGRKDAFSPLLDLQFTDSDFEEELGQVDGTLAHAIERIFALVVKKQGYQLIDSNFRIPKLQKRYNYAKRS
jgi:lipopolysaccharide biosynthesis protein